jgi:hypothetical protein
LEVEMHGAVSKGSLFGCLFLALAFSASCANELGSAKCEVATDCAAGEACVEGTCSANGIECGIDTDCGLGAFCYDGRCVSELDPGAGEGEGEGEPGGTGVVKITPGGEIDFGSPILGVGVERTISVMNFGEGIFEVTGLSLAPGTSDEFSWSTDIPLPVSLEVGDRVEVTLIYTLADGEDDTGAINVHTTAAACDPACDDPAAIAVPLLSEFKGVRNLSVSPDLHDFGYVAPAQASPPRSVLITNDGTIDKVLTVTGIDFTGDLTEFDWEPLPLPLLLSPGESAELPVVYQPTTSASGHQLTVNVTANSDNPERTTGTARFVATSQPPNALVFNPPELIFPQLAIGQSQQQVSVLKNIGGTPINVTNLTLGLPSSTEYVVQSFPATPYTLLPDAEMNVYVDFTSQTGTPSANSVTALNDQPSGDAPVLNLRGDSYIPPGGPNVTIATGPQDGQMDGCLCQATGNVPAANVDLSYRETGSGAVCSKPQQTSCALNGGSCECPAMDAYGDVSWGSDRTEEVRGETWIINEKVEHVGEGQDGTFVVKADLIDDCLAVPGSTSVAVNHGCCILDCDNGGPQQCYPYGSYPHCATECDYWANTATSQDCLMRGPAAIKTSVRIWGGSFDETRYFCTTLQQSGASSNIVTLDRQGGYFTIASVSPGVTEVDAATPCQ